MLTVEFRPQRTTGMFYFGDEPYTPVTLAVPSVLFEDVTVHKVRGETPKPPVASHPYFDSK
jgi:hypothetical protein